MVAVPRIEPGRCPVPKTGDSPLSPNGYEIIRPWVRSAKAGVVGRRAGSPWHRRETKWSGSRELNPDNLCGRQEHKPLCHTRSNHRNPLRTSPGPRQRRTRKPKARKSWWTTRESNSPHAPCKGASPPRNMRSHEFDGGYLRESNAAPPARKGCRTSSYTKAPHHQMSSTRKHRSKREHAHHPPPGARSQWKLFHMTLKRSIVLFTKPNALAHIAAKREVNRYLYVRVHALQREGGVNHKVK